MTDLKHKAEQFRALHVPGRPFVVFNVWDAGSARAVVAGGAKAVATSSWSVANANGFPDGERIPGDLAIDNLRRIVRVTDLPVTIDLESGYGEAPEAAGETVRLAMDAGVRRLQFGGQLSGHWTASGGCRSVQPHSVCPANGRYREDSLLPQRSNRRLFP